METVSGRRDLERTSVVRMHAKKAGGVGVAAVSPAESSLAHCRLDHQGKPEQGRHRIDEV